MLTSKVFAQNIVLNEKFVDNKNAIIYAKPRANIKADLQSEIDFIKSLMVVNNASIEIKQERSFTDE